MNVRDIREGWSRSNVVSAAPLAVIVVAGAILSYRSHAILRQDRDMVVHTYQVLGTVKDALLATEEAETGARGFVITGDPEFLEPYDKARNEGIPASLADLGRLLIRNRRQQGRLAQLRNLVKEKLDQIEGTIKIRREGHLEAARVSIGNQQSERVMNRIRALASEMDDEEEKLLRERAGHVAQSEARILWLAAATAAVSVTARILIAVKHAKRKAGE